MAQNLINGVVNMFTLTDGLNVISSGAPSGDVGVAKQGDGFYLYSLKDVIVWYKYDIGGWQEYINIDSTDEDFNDSYIDGGMLPWTNHETHGVVEAVYFQTQETDHEIRLFVIDGNVITDYIPSDDDFDERFVSFNGDTIIIGSSVADGDGYVKVEHDLDGYKAGDEYETVISIGSVDKVVSFMDRFKNLNANYKYSIGSGQTKISFIVPDIKNDKSRFHSYVSLAPSGIEPASVPLVTTGMKFSVRVGNRNQGDGSLRYQLPFAGTFTVDWGDGNVEQCTNIKQVNEVVHEYATPGDYTILLEDAEITTVRNLPARSYQYHFLSGAGINANEYKENADSDNLGPIALNKYMWRPMLDTVDSITFEDPQDESLPQKMHIVDSTGKNWADVFNLTDAKFSDVTKPSMQVGGYGGYGFSGYTATFNSSTNTTTIELDHGCFYYGNGGKLSERASDWYGPNRERNLFRIYLFADPNGNQVQQDWAIAKGQFMDYDNQTIAYTDTQKMIDIERWGDVVWGSNSLVGGFGGALDLEITATDSPDWSDVTSLKQTFAGCRNMTDFNNTLSSANICTSNVLSLEGTFNGCSKFANTDLSAWDTSNVINFFQTFYNSTVFNGNVDNWLIKNNGENNLNFNQTFRGAHLFNRNINTKQRADGRLAWDMADAVNTQFMFNNCPGFDQPLNNWNTSKVTNMRNMFSCGVQSKLRGIFNQDINTALVNVGGTSYVAWDTSSVTTMRSMFHRNQYFNGNISYWDTSGVVTCEDMFNRTDYFNVDINTKSVTVNGNTYNAWDVKACRSFSYMFEYARRFNQPISNWNISQGSIDYTVAEDDGTVYSPAIFALFNHAHNYNQPMDTQSVTVGGETWTAWDTSLVTNIGKIFQNAWSFNQPLTNWDISFVYGARYAFNGAHSFNQDLSTWGTNGNGTTSLGLCGWMFANMGAMTYGNSFTTWDVSNVTETFMMFALMRYRLNSWPLSDLEDSYVEWVGENHNLPYPGTVQVIGTDADGNDITYRHYPFIPNVANWNLSNVKSAASMFRGGNVNFNPDLSAWSNNTWSNLLPRGTAKPGVIVEDATWGWGIDNMFNGCVGFEGIGLENWETSNVESLRGLFERTSIGDVFANWDVRSVKDMQRTFYLNSGNFVGTSITNWKPISLQNLASTFASCPNFNGDISQWPVTKLTSLSGTFNQSRQFNQDISTKSAVYTDPIDGITYDAWDVSNVTNMQGMLYNYHAQHLFAQDLSNWNTSSLKNMAWLSRGEGFSQNTDVSGWDISNVERFQGDTTTWHIGPYSRFGTTTAIYDNILISWAANVAANGTAINLDKPWPYVSFGDSKYTPGGAAEAARNQLIATGWQIRDGGAA
jgi:surface protein